MRPVERGPCPKDETGVKRVFPEYADARPHLTNRMGDYCSFCEMQLPAALAVEHIQHKYGNPGLECEWDNFLLACPSCNSTKGTKVDTAEDVLRRLWPHLHRTFDAFIYRAGGIVHLAAMDDPVLAARAEQTEAMVGLTRRPGAGLTEAKVDRNRDNRWKKRREAWDEAITARTTLSETDTAGVRRCILAIAHATGFWSVWMTVFHDDPQMQAALCETFRGTARDRVFPLPAHLDQAE
jgi:HNH endonuclease